MPSRTKIENVLMLGFNCANVSLYLFTIAAAVLKSLHADFSQIVMCIYGSLIAAVLVVNECRQSDVSLLYFRFVSLYRGRGMILIFFGCMVLSVEVVNIIAGTLNLVFGFLYIILSFIPSFPAPNPIVINWQNWKDFSAEGLDLRRSRDTSSKSDMATRLKLPSQELRVNIPDAAHTPPE